MLELIKFETCKLLRKPLVWAALAGVLFFLALMEYNWVVPGYSSVQEFIGGKRMIINGFEAIAKNQEISALYSGSLTDAEIKAIVEAYDIEDEVWINNGLEPSRERNYAHNLIYDSLSHMGFANPDGSYSGTTMEEVFGALAPELILGYSSGWECTIYVLIHTFLLWGCAVIIIVAPVFAEEYTRHMDALILTGKAGKKQSARAKLLAAFLVAITGALLILAVATGLLLAIHGKMGFDASVQLGELGYLQKTPEPLTWLQAYGLACIAWFGGILVVTALTLLISALAKNSFSALVITFVIYALPLFLPWKQFAAPLQLFGALQPINLMQLSQLFQRYSLRFGSVSLAPAWLVLPVALAVLAIGIPWARRAFSGHQVA